MYNAELKLKQDGRLGWAGWQLEWPHQIRAVTPVPCPAPRVSWTFRTESCMPPSLLECFSHQMQILLILQVLFQKLLPLWSSLNLVAPFLLRQNQSFLSEAPSKFVLWGCYSLYSRIPSLKTLCPPCQILISPRTENIKHFKVFPLYYVNKSKIYFLRENLAKLPKVKMKKNHFISPLP